LVQRAKKCPILGLFSFLRMNKSDIFGF